MKLVSKTACARISTPYLPLYLELHHLVSYSLGRMEDTTSQSKQIMYVREVPFWGSSNRSTHLNIDQKVEESVGSVYLSLSLHVAVTASAAAAAAGTRQMEETKEKKVEGVVERKENEGEKEGGKEGGKEG